MKAENFVVAVTLVNAALFAFSFAHPRTTAAQDVAPVLRGRALQIVDEHGRVRASIAVYPPDPNVKMPDGSKGYPETVLLRLITSKGRPSVKIAATEDGSVVALGGESDPAYAQILARGDTPSIKLNAKDGKQTIVEP